MLKHEWVGHARFNKRIDDQQKNIGGNDSRWIAGKWLLRQARFVVLVIRRLFKNVLRLLQNLFHDAQGADETLIDSRNPF